MTYENYADSPWHGKAVLVTGGSAGLGRAIAAAFADAGAQVAIAARGREGLDQAVEQLRAQGRTVLAVQADVTQQADVERMLRETVERCGRLDVLVNNAGRSSRGTVLETTPEEFRELLELNLIAAARTTTAAAPHLLAVQRACGEYQLAGGQVGGPISGSV